MKRAFSMLLVIAMVIAMLPQFPATAAATEQETTEPITEVVEPTVPALPDYPQLLVDQVQTFTMIRNTVQYLYFIPEISGEYTIEMTGGSGPYAYMYPYLNEDVCVHDGDLPATLQLEEGVCYVLEAEIDDRKATEVSFLVDYIEPPAELLGVSLQQAEWKPCNNGNWYTYEQDGTSRDYYEYQWWYQPFVADFSDGSQVVFRPGDGVFYHPSGSETYSVEYFNYQSAENAWQPGNAYTVDMAINGVPYSDELWIDPIPEIFLNMPQDAVIDAQDQWAWFSFVPDQTAEYTFTANGSNDTVGYLYDANFKMLTSNDDGASNNQFKIVCTLEAGATYYLAAKYYSPGYTGSFPVYLSRNASVESITFEPVVLEPYTGGSSQYGLNGQYYHYDWAQWAEKVCYTVTLSDGTSFQGTGPNVVIGGEYVEMRPANSSQQGSDAWLPGESQEVLMRIGDNNYPLTVTIGEVATLPAEGETFVEITEAGQKKLFLFTPEHSGTYSFVSNGTCDTEAALYDLAYVHYTGNDDAYDENFELTYDLEAGRTYLLSVHLSYKSEETTGSFSVRVVGETYVERVDFAPVELNACIGGGFESYSSGSEQYYRYYWWQQLSYTVTMSDGQTYLFTGEQFTVNGKEYFITQYDDQDYNNPWLPGNSYTATVEVDGQQYSVTVNIQDFPDLVADVPMELTMKADKDQYLRFVPEISGSYSFASTITQGDPEAYLYDADMKYLVYDDDSGGNLNFKVEYMLEAGQTYYLKVHPRNDNHFTVMVTKQMGVRSVTVEPIRIAAGTNGNYVSMSSSASGDQFFRYYWWNNLQYTVTFDNGDVYTGSGLSFSYNDSYFEFNYSDEQSYLSPWTAGNTYYPSVSLMGTAAHVQVSIAEVADVTILVDDVTLTENVNGHYVDIYDPDIGAYQQTFIYTWWNQLHVSLQYSDGPSSSYPGGSDIYYEGHRAPVGFTDLDQRTNPWTAGNTYAVQLQLLGQTFTVNVTIRENPVERIEFQPVSMVENTTGYLSSYYDEQMGDYREYWYYSWYTNTNCTVYLKDGNTVQGDGTGFDYNGTWVGFSTYDNQGSQEQWTAGNTYTAQVKVFGTLYEIPVTITESPIASVEFDTVYLLENMDGRWTSDYSSGIGEYFRYEWEDKLSYTVTLKNGESFRGSGRDVEYDGQQYAIRTRDSQNTSPWYRGETCTAEVNVTGQWQTVPVQVVVNPISDIQFSTIKLERDDGHYAQETSGNQTYWRYDWEDNIHYTVTCTDGTVLEGTGSSVTINGMTFRFTVFDEQSSYNPWRAGTVNYGYARVLGTTYTVPVRIEDPSPEELGLPIIVPNQDYTVNITEPGQRVYYAFSPETTGRYTFRSYLLDGNYLDSYGELYNAAYEMLQTDDDGARNGCFSVEYTLEAGCTYIFAARLYSSGDTASFRVKLLQQEKVASIHVQPLSLMVSTCGGLESMDSGAAQFYRYYWWNQMQYTVTFENGDTISGIGDNFTYKELTYWINHQDTQYGMPWQAGNTYTAVAFLQDAGCEVAITIEASPVERIVLDPLLLNAETGGYRTEYWDDISQQYVPVYRYNWWNYVSGTIYLTNGNQLPIRNGWYEYSGENHLIGYADNQYGNFWRLGGSYTETVSVMGVSQSISISITTPVESLSVSPIYLLENTGGEYVLLNSGMEKVYQYYWWNKLQFNVTYKDGGQQSYSGTGFHYNGNDVEVIRVDTQNQSPWQVGNTYTAMIRVMGVEVPVQVNILSGFSGQLGDVTWSVGSGGVLRLMGQGDILWDQSYLPWNEHKNSIQSIIIEPGITSVPDNLFANYYNVTSVTLADTVTRIGRRAFAHCANMTELNCSNGLLSIGIEAFYQCVSLREVDLGDSLNTIENHAFAWCSNMTKLVLPATLQSIGSYAFQGCHDLANVEFGGTQDAWELLDIGAENNPLYEAQITCTGTPTQVGSGTVGSLSWVLSGDGVLNISGEGDMEDFSPEAPAPWNQCGQRIRKVILGEGITSLGNYALYGCTGLKVAEFPDSLRMVGEGAFHSCRSLRTAMFGPALAEIGNYAFYDCGALYEIYLSACLGRIGDAAFSGCDGLAEVYYSAAGYLWGAIEIGYDNEALNNAYMYTVEDEAVMKSGVCGDDLIWTLSYSGLLTISGNGPMYDYDFRDPSWSDVAGDILALEIHSGVTSIGNGAFRDLYWLQSVQLPGTLTRIGMQAFYGVGSLEELTLPEGLVEIGEEAFSHCDGLRTVTLPESLVTISFEAFGYCSELTQITIPAATTNMAHNVFSGCGKLTGICVSQDNSAYCDVGGVLLTKDGRELICAPGGLTGSYTIPESVEEIYLQAFMGCAGLTEIVIPDTVTAIGPQTFQGCINLEKVTLGSGVTEIGMGMFANTGLTTMVIPEGVTVIQPSAFESCTELTRVVIPEGVTEIHDRAFANCVELTEAALPKSLTYLGSNVFEGCGKLTSVAIPQNVTEIGQFAFANCASLTEVIVPAGVTSVGAYAFRGCIRLTKVELPAGVTSIGEGAFEACVNLTEAKLPEGVTEFVYRMFAGCENLETVEIPSTVVSIGEQTFAQCTNLTAVNIPDSVQTLGDRVFAECEKLETVSLGKGVAQISPALFNDCYALSAIHVSADNENYSSNAGILFDKGMSTLLRCPMAFEGAYEIPETVQWLEDNAFRSCEKLTAITVPAQVSLIPDRCFADCTGLARVDLSGTSVDQIGWETFAGCTALEEITFPETLRIIDEGAFAHCYRLTTLTLPEGLEEIYWYAFEWCSELREVYLPESLTFVGEGAFECCNALQTVYYAGTEGQWNQIRIDHFGNENLRNAEKVFGKTAQPVSMSIVSLPSKLDYLLGEALDLNGLQLEIVLDDGARQFVPCEVVSGYDHHSRGEQVITVSYGQFSATFTVTVRAHPVTILTQPADCTASVGTKALFTVAAEHVASYQWQYRRSESHNWTNTAMEGYNTDTLHVVVTAARDGYQYRCELENLDGMTYYTDAATLHVGERSVVSIDFGSLPVNNTFYQDQLPDFTGMTVIATYSDGTSEDVTEKCAIHQPIYTEPGLYHISVDFDEYTLWLDFVMLANPVEVTGIEVTQLPDKTNYVQGEEMSVAGMVVTVSYSDGSTMLITDAFTLTGYDANTVGSQTVTVHYEGFTASFTVQVMGAIVGPSYGSIQLGVPYKMAMSQNNLNKQLYFNGNTESATVNYRLGTTEDPTEAVDVYLEAGTAGGYSLYFIDKASQKIYIRIYERDAAAGKGSLMLTTEAPSEALTYDTTYKTLVYTSQESGNAYYMGTYSSYSTFSVSNTSYLTSENVGVSQFPATLLKEDELPDAPVVPEIPELPAEDGAQITIAEALAAASAMSHATYTERKYTVTGVVDEIVNAEYGDLYIADEEGNRLYVYGIYSADGTTQYNGLDVPPAIGDTVTLYGIIGRWNDRCEMKHGWLMEHSGPVRIVTQPENAEVAPGETAEFSVKAGFAAAYAWQYRLNETADWRKASGAMNGADTNTMTIEASLKRNGYQYRCEITGQDGTVIYTEPATLIVTEPVLITGIEIMQLPKAQYFLGEELDTTFLDVAVNYSNGQVKYMSDFPGEFAITGYDANTLGEQILTVSFREFTTTFTVTVLADTVEAVTIVALPNKTQYTWGEELDLTGLALEVTMASGKTVAVESYEVAGYSANVVGKQTVTIRYEGVEASFEVEVLPAVTEITRQPESITVNSGDTAQFTVETQGQVVSYQWQYRTIYKWFNTTMEGFNTNVLNVSANGQRHGYEYRCQVTFADGTVLYTDAATLSVNTVINITGHPNDQVVALGAKGQFTAAAEGETIKYQWQYCRPDSDKWIDTAMEGATKPTVFIECTAARNGYQYRCQITDVAGNVAYTEPATLSVLSVKGQPVNAYAPVGGTATFTVTASVADGFTYQWQYRRNSTGGWTNTTMAGYNTATLTVSATKARNGYEYRCVLTGAKNSKIESNGAKLTVSDPVVITAQPQSLQSAAGQTAVFSVTANNVLSYQWQYQRPNSTAWTNTSAAGNKTETVSVTVKANNNGYKYRCQIVGLDGITYYTEVATLTFG